MNIKTLSGADIKTPNGEITNGKIIIGVVFQLAAGNCLHGPPTNKITNGKKNNGDSADFCFQSFVYRHLQTKRLSCTRGEDSTPRRTDIFLGLLMSSTRTPEHF